TIAFDVAAGWGLATTLLLLAALFDVPFAPVLLAEGAFGILGMCRRRGAVADRLRTLGLLALAVVFCFPLMMIAAATPAIFYDEFGHWLPNARFVFENGILPSELHPNLWSDISGYPYGGPFINYAASMLASQWLDAPSKLFTIVL